MKANPYRSTVFGVLFAALVPLSAAHAQLGDMLKQATGSGDSSSALGNLGGIGGALGGSSLTSSSSSNVAGVLQFCIKNNYLGGAGGGGASSVKDALMSKLGGGASSDSGYTSGASGILDAGNGKTLDLSGGGLKEQVTKQVCDKILSQAKSLL
ncbi:DUF2501 domain-containing protein [Burkholderia sp. FERM BP-3421]|jgi:Protein of unknown function (DUF2501)|uniref:DUF2501 domain-containing protein n=1 Tax=Burkholderia sp. FERM BP-3421 TaxID=1494466 RepID=UPI002360E53B|nr:DUF2501 domain-containing protein [Burkholderia sp. FERM BP-3421]WDD95175.1 DUF2501 domain-containing protein [Burkholderia sp. FERM BP-3421]